MKALIWIICIVLALYIGYKIIVTISVYKNVRQKYNEGAIILDVRTETEFNTGHIAGALNISLGTLRQRYTELDSSKTYITCCSHGLRSIKAEKILKERGFKHVYNGGAWSDLTKVITK